jgi:uncharacterized protein
MQEVIAILDDRLASAGDTIPLSGHLDEQGYELGEHQFTLPSGLDFDVMLTNAGEGILATGIVRGHVVGTCDRCLEPAEFDLAAEVDEYFLFKAPSTTQSLGEDEDDVDFSLVGEDHTIDLTEAIASAVLMDTPFVVLCREDCKGLCPVCGENLNLVDCGHAQQIEEQRLESSPFAVLRSLKLDD